MIEFKLPDIGEGIAEGEIVKWLIGEGDSVDEHQPIVEVMTDKATVEIPSPAGGRIAKLHAAEGDTVPVGTVIFNLDDSAGASSGSQAAPAPAAAAPAPAAASAPPPVAAAAPGPSPGGGETMQFKLPDIGEGIAEGEVVKWLVGQGDAVAEHQPVVEVMTDKATVEIPAPAAGRIAALRASEGDTVPVGAVLFLLETQAGAAVAAASAPAAPAAAAAAAAVPATAGVAAAPAPATGARTNGKVLAVPSARRVARELGIDLSQVPGSGRGGVVRRKDVEAFAAGGGRVATPEAPASAPTPAAAARSASSVAAALPAPGGETRRPFRGVRRKIADAMVRSKFTATHFTVVEEVDVTDLVKLRQKAKAVGAEQGIKVTYMPFIMKATALGLARISTLNGHLDEEAQEIVNPAYVNLGIAIDTDNGLIVPVIDRVESKGMLQLAAELQDLGERTRQGKIKPEELRGSTFTITNAGGIGGTLATPIINYPDIAILGVHRIVKRPGVVETEEGEHFEVRQYMNFSCSVDHRLADGADAARFLAYLRTLLENPGLLAL